MAVSTEVRQRKMSLVSDRAIEQEDVEACLGLLIYHWLEASSTQHPVQHKLRINQGSRLVQ